MSPRTVAVAVAVALGLTPALAVAGPVAQSARGVENTVETHEAEDDDAASDDDDDEPSSLFDDDDATCGAACAPRVGVHGGRTSLAPVLLPLHGEVSLGAQSIVGSDLGLAGAARLTSPVFSAIVGAATYRERVASKDGTREWVGLDHAYLGAGVRPLHAGGGSVWVEGGGAALRTTATRWLGGPWLGVRLEAEVAPALRLSATGRGAWLEHDLFAVEGELALAARFVYVSYKVFDLDVGPPIHGPAAGVVATF